MFGIRRSLEPAAPVGWRPERACACTVSRGKYIRRFPLAMPLSACGQNFTVTRNARLLC